MKHYRIVVVDDEKETLDSMEEILKKDGYEVSKFFVPEDALTAIQKEPPDLVLLDIQMPRINGWAFCHRLLSQEATRNVPIIFTTNLAEGIKAAEDDLKMQALSFDAKDIIHKVPRRNPTDPPVNPELLLKMVEHHLRKAEKPPPSLLPRRKIPRAILLGVPSCIVGVVALSYWLSLDRRATTPGRPPAVTIHEPAKPAHAPDTMRGAGPTGKPAPTGVLRPVPPVKADPPDAGYQKQLDDGFAHFDQGEFGAAIDCFSNAVGGKETALSYAGYAIALYRTGNRGEAREYYARAIRLEPAFAEGSGAIARKPIRRFSSAQEAAIDELARLVKAGPSH